MYPLLLAGSLIFSVSIIANAQPPTPPSQLPSVFDYSCPGGQTPELAVEKFFDNSWSPEAAAKFVEGADADSPALKELSQIIRDHLGKFQLGAIDIKTSIDPKNPDLATAEFTLVLSDELGHAIMQPDSISLDKHTSPKCTYWMIVPGKPELPKDSYYMTGHLTKMSGMTLRLATEIAHPQEMLTLFHLHQSESNVKQIMLGIFMYVQDTDNQINLTPQNYKYELMPYLKSNILFTAPGDVVGTVSYDINSNLAGANDLTIKNPHTLVALYQGHDQKLDFKYGDNSVVGFADGHVEAVTREQAKSLRWKP